MGRKSFENPLLSHARMRGLYRGLVETTALRLAPRGSEACFVASCIDLKEGDLVFGGAGQKASNYLRALGMRKGNGGPTSAGVRKVLEGSDERFAGTGYESLLCAGGAAMALKAGGGDAVVVALTAGGGSIEASWMRALRVSGAAELPLVLLVLPDGSETDWTVVGKRANVPVIPVDAADAVGLYRVAQESIGRARADRRGAIIECVASRANATRMMGEQLVAKGIATAAWLAGVESDFTMLLSETGQAPRTVRKAAKQV